jgi:hypothetical protein
MPMSAICSLVQFEQSKMMLSLDPSYPFIPKMLKNLDCLPLPMSAILLAGQFDHLDLTLALGPSIRSFQRYLIPRLFPHAICSSLVQFEHFNLTVSLDPSYSFIPKMLNT